MDCLTFDGETLRFEELFGGSFAIFEGFEDSFGGLLVIFGYF